MLEFQPGRIPDPTPNSVSPEGERREAVMNTLYLKLCTHGRKPERCEICNRPRPLYCGRAVWTEATQACDCSTCGRDIWIGDRCVLSGPTIHCRICGTTVCTYEDNGAIQSRQKARDGSSN